MATETWLVPVVTAIMSGGIVGGISQLWGARNTSKQLKMEEQKTPADIGTVLLGGASQAVTVLTNSLQYAQNELEGIRAEQTRDRQRIRELMASNDSKDARIAEMERELSSLRLRLGELQTALDRAQTRINEMRGGSNGSEST